jgi:signal transduction histidine kinase
MTLDIINIIILIVSFLTTILGFVIVLGDGKNDANRYFFYFCLSATCWGITMFSYRMSQSVSGAFIAARLLYVSAAFIPIIFISFIKKYDVTGKTLSALQKIVLILPFLLIIYLALMPGALIRGVLFPDTGEKIIVFDQQLHLVYAFYIMGYFLLGYIELFRRIKENTGLKRQRFIGITIGTLISSIVGVITNLLMPFFGDFSLNWLGQSGVIVMVAVIFYYILRYQLFNVKVIVTEILVFTLWVFILIRTLLSVSTHDGLLNGVLLLITIPIGTLLIQSVLHEVKQREQTATLAQDLQKANEGQSNLIHIINHQIKGYLSKGRIVLSELLTNPAYENNLSVEAKKLAQQGFDFLTEGNDFIQGILHASSIEAGVMRYEKVLIDLRSIVATSMHKYDSAAKHKGLLLEAHTDDGSYEILADERLLSEAIGNLIDNAIKYSHSGTIVINLRSDPYIVTFTIKDTGVGITDEDKKKLFTRGGKGRNSSRVNVDSTGYGLYFVKNVVAAHGGEVHADSEGQNKGATFTITLPKHNAQTSTVPSGVSKTS